MGNKNNQNKKNEVIQDNNQYGYLKDKIILAVGYGISGKKITELVKRQNGTAYIFDNNKDVVVDKNYVDKTYSNVDDIIWDEINVVVLSPGVPLDVEVVVKAKENNVEVIGEIEFAYRYSKGTILGITGTNGKTTTTQILGDICKHSEKGKEYTLGNIGEPFTAVADKLENEDVVALELSSFQLETIKDFRPKISAVLNISEDHLNRHKTMDNYVKAKFNICKNQSEGDYIILNVADEYIENYVTSNYISPDLRIIWFSAKLSKDEIEAKIEDISKRMYDYALNSEKLKDEKEKKDFKNNYASRYMIKRYIYEKDGNIILYDDEKDIIDKKIVSKENIKVPGKHNVENIMVASVSAYYYGIKEAYIEEAVSKFYGVEHRIEYVGEKKGVKYYNDSKATNPDAAAIGVKAMNMPTILLLGGSDKKVSFDMLAKTILQSNVKESIVYGECKEGILASLKKYNIPTKIGDNMEDSFKKAVLDAKKGDVILLSPACASFDEFKSYEQRGDLFKKLYEEI